MTRQQFKQAQFENVLSAHWHKLYQIKELEETSTGSGLRLVSIAKRKKELAEIENQLLVLEQLDDDCCLVYPTWYTDRIRELNGQA